MTDTTESSSDFADAIIFSRRRAEIPAELGGSSTQFEPLVSDSRSQGGWFLTRRDCAIGVRSTHQVACTVRAQSDASVHPITTTPGATFALPHRGDAPHVHQAVDRRLLADQQTGRTSRELKDSGLTLGDAIGHRPSIRQVTSWSTRWEPPAWPQGRKWASHYWSSAPRPWASGSPAAPWAGPCTTRASSSATSRRTRSRRTSPGRQGSGQACRWPTATWQPPCVEADPARRRRIDGEVVDPDALQAPAEG